MSADRLSGRSHLPTHAIKPNTPLHNRTQAIRVLLDLYYYSEPRWQAFARHVFICALCVVVFFLHFAGWDEGGHERGQRGAERGQRGAPGQRAVKGSVVTVAQRKKKKSNRLIKKSVVF